MVYFPGIKVYGTDVKRFVKSLTEKYFDDNMKNALLWLTIQ